MVRSIGNDIFSDHKLRNGHYELTLSLVLMSKTISNEFSLVAE